MPLGRRPVTQVKKQPDGTIVVTQFSPHPRIKKKTAWRPNDGKPIDTAKYGELVFIDYEKNPDLFITRNTQDGSDLSHPVPNKSLLKGRRHFVQVNYDVYEHGSDAVVRAENGKPATIEYRTANQNNEEFVVKSHVAVKNERPVLTRDESALMEMQRKTADNNDEVLALREELAETKKAQEKTNELLSKLLENQIKGNEKEPSKKSGRKPKSDTTSK